MARLKSEQPAAWSFGEALAAEALSSRSADLVRMIHEGGKEGRDQYARAMAREVVMALASGELEAEFPITDKSLEAVGVACGTALIDALQAESQPHTGSK
jgi:hypothetical protein